MGKSKAPRKKRKARTPPNKLKQEIKKMRDNAGLLLRLVAHLVQHSPQIAAHYRERGDARIPLGALESDVEVGIFVEDDHLVIAPAPRPPEEAPTTPDIVRDLLSLASKYVTLEELASWTPAQLEHAADWAGREHLHASDNHDVERMTVPNHVRHLPDIIGCDPPSPFVPGGPWITRLRHADGRVTAFTQIPGDPSSRKEIES